MDFCQNRVPKCPYCEAVYEIEYGFSEDDRHQVDCGTCGKIFFIEPVVLRSYTTSGDCETNGEMPHELFMKSEHVKQYQCKKCILEFYDWQLPCGTYPRLKQGDFVVVPARPQPKDNK